MTIDEIECALNSIKIVLEHTEKGYYPEQFKTHEECLKEVMDIVRKYQQLQTDYENRLKADMVAMLKELQLEIEELWDNRYDVWLDNQYYIGKSNTLEEVDEIIQQKIDKLKENKNESY